MSRWEEEKQMLNKVYKWSREEQKVETAFQNVREGNCKSRSHQVALQKIFGLSSGASIQGIQ